MFAIRKVREIVFGLCLPEGELYENTTDKKNSIACLDITTYEDFIEEVYEDFIKDKKDIADKYIYIDCDNKFEATKEEILSYIENKK